MALVTICCWNHLQELSEFDESPDVGRENRALVRLRENAQETANLKLAERVGFFDAVFENPNECRHSQRNARHGNDLAPPDFFQRLRLFAGICRFCQRDGTRHGTRPETLGGLVPRDSRASIAWEIASDALPRLLLTLRRTEPCDFWIVKE